MPEPVQVPAPAVEETPSDMFGFPTAPAPEAAAPVEEAKKPEQQKPATIEDMSKRLDDYEKKFADLHDANTKKDENIRVMRDLIREFKKSGGKPVQQGTNEQKPAAIFDTVKTSKDLTKDEREDMTETEIRQMDEIAALKNGMNQLFKAISEGKGEPAKPADGEEDNDDDAGDAADEAVKSARTIALELAGNDETIANEIIEQVNKFNIVGLKPEDLRKRVEDANKLRPTYTPPKEQVRKPGGPVKGAGSGTDPFGNEQIINEVQKSRTSGNVYKL